MTSRHILARLIPIVILLASVAPASATPVPATPESTPAPIACDDIGSYVEDVYRVVAPDASLTEIGIARAAWDGPGAYAHMSLVELHTAQVYFKEWAWAFEATPGELIPAGLEPLHELNIRRVELHSDSVLAYLRADDATQSEIIAEMREVERAVYAFELFGVAQCGDAWIDVFGEPQDYSSDVAPATSSLSEDP